MVSILMIGDSVIGVRFLMFIERFLRARVRLRKNYKVIMFLGGWDLSKNVVMESRALGY